MKKAIKILISLSLFFCLSLPVSAQLINGEALSGLEKNTQEVQMSSGLGQTSIGSIIATIIQAALGLLAAIFIVLMVVAGFQWMTAGGNEAQVKKAQDTIKTAVIGLIIVLAAYAITYFIFKYLPFSGSPINTGGDNGGVGGT